MFGRVRLTRLQHKSGNHPAQKTAENGRGICACKQAVCINTTKGVPRDPDGRRAMREAKMLIGERRNIRAGFSGFHAAGRTAQPGLSEEILSAAGTAEGNEAGRALSVFGQEEQAGIGTQRGVSGQVTQSSHPHAGNALTAYII